MDNNSFNNSLEEQLKQLKQDKEIFCSQLEDIRAEIDIHNQKFHSEISCDCTGSLTCLDTNIQCLIEDTNEWSKNDRESWILVVSPEGVCEQGQDLVSKVQALIQSTQEWEMLYPQLLDGMCNSIDRLNNYSNKYEQEILELQSQEQQQQQTKQNIQSKGPLQNNNFFQENKNIKNKNTKNSQQNNENLQDQFEMDEEEQFIFEQLNEKKAQMIKKLDLITQNTKTHISQHKGCPGQVLINQIVQLQKDIEYWTRIDRQSWESIWNVIQVKDCKHAIELKNEIEQNVILVLKSWEENKDFQQFLDTKTIDQFRLKNNLNDIGYNTKGINLQNTENFNQLFSNIEGMEADLMDSINQLLKIHQNQDQIDK